jgi:hypothetical protein
MIRCSMHFMSCHACKNTNPTMLSPFVGGGGGGGGEGGLGDGAGGEEGQDAFHAAGTAEKVAPRDRISG